MMVGCGSNNTNEKGNGCDYSQDILDVFDLTDPKDIWDGSFNDVQFDSLIPNTHDVAIFVTFRRIRDGEEYPTLEACHFDLSNIKNFLYSTHQKPHDWPVGKVFRQTAWIYLLDNTPTAFAGAIRHLENLCFIVSARPANTVYLNDGIDW